MRIQMVGVDYKTADMAVRERFAVTISATKEHMQGIRCISGVLGCVLLSTCNRTELYLSLEDGAEVDAVSVFCNACGVAIQEYGVYVRFRSGDNAARHLMMVAAGLRSQIRGEDQILAQVKAAAELARELRSTDAVLETLFRCAVSAAKRAKTEVPIAPVETSVARRAVQVLRAETGGLAGKRVLVIGNGEMGRTSASLLAEEGCSVTMTLRSYRHGVTVIPNGCETVPYDMRYNEMERSDLLVSATASPHFTIQAEGLKQCRRIPPYLVDLAVPRDIEPEAAALSGVKVCWNVDTLGANALGEEGTAKLMAVKEIIEQFMRRFADWNSYRALLPVRERERLG